MTVDGRIDGDGSSILAASKRQATGRQHDDQQRNASGRSSADALCRLVCRRVPVPDLAARIGSLVVIEKDRDGRLERPAAVASRGTAVGLDRQGYVGRNDSPM